MTTGPSGTVAANSGVAFVDAALRRLGLGPLPTVSGTPPMPGLAPPPLVDMHALLRPLVDLLEESGGDERMAAAHERVEAIVTRLVECALSLGGSLGTPIGQARLIDLFREMIPPSGDR